MASIIAKRYGKALFDLAREKTGLDRMQADADQIESVWKSQPQLKDMLLLPTMPKEEEKRVLAAIMGCEVSEDMLGLLYLLIDKGRILYLPEILQEYQRLRLEEARITKAYVTSATPLTKEEEIRVQEALEKAMHCRIVLQTETDPNLIGGIVVRVGDQIFDNSLRTKLQNMKKDLLLKKISREVAR